MPTICEIKTDFVKLAENYAGLWVALHPQTDEVVASGESPAEVLAAAIAAGVPDVIVTKVLADYGSYVTCLG